jgi:hypothetical protein
LVPSTLCLHRELRLQLQPEHRAPGRVQVGQYNLNGATWQSYSNTNLNLTNYAGGIMRLVFEWRNDSSGGTQPPVAVDNIVLRVCSTAHLLLQ